MYNVFMQKYFLVFFAGVIITLLVFFGLNKFKENKINKQQTIITDQLSCKIDSDCQATCANGCVNSDWMKGRNDCATFSDITCTCFNGQCIDKGLEPENPPGTTGSGCYIQGCHGLDISCGISKVEFCDEMYKLGDSCRQYARCETIDGKCEPILDKKFNDCKDCVQNCEYKYKDNPTEMSDCESSCFE